MTGSLGPKIPADLDADVAAVLDQATVVAHERGWSEEMIRTHVISGALRAMRRRSSGRPSGAVGAARGTGPGPSPTREPAAAPDSPEEAPRVPVAVGVRALIGAAAAINPPAARRRAERLWEPAVTVPTRAVVTVLLTRLRKKIRRRAR